MKQCNNVTIKSGFTLIEVLVAITVMTIGIVGTLIAVQQAVAVTSLSRSRFTAAYLAQEGIEIIRNIRDTNWVEDTSWDQGLFCASPPCCWEADYNNTTSTTPDLTPCASSTYDNLNFLNIDNNNFYSYSSGEQTQFKRGITIQKPQSHILKVSVTVYWGKEGEHQITAQENLYDWR